MIFIYLFIFLDDSTHDQYLNKKRKGPQKQKEDTKYVKTLKIQNGKFDINYRYPYKCDNKEFLHKLSFFVEKHKKQYQLNKYSDRHITFYTDLMDNEIILIDRNSFLNNEKKFFSNKMNNNLIK